MARGGGSRSRRSEPARPRPTPRPQPRPRAAPPEPPRVEERRTLRLGAVVGATPGTWITKWRERFPHVELELVPLAAGTALEGAVDVAIVRLPVDEDALHVIPLYDEVTVAVVAADSHLTAADELELADLAGEVVIVPGDDVLAADIPGAVAPSFAPPDDTADAVATIAAGVGVALMPMSIARVHARKDVTTRPVTDAPVSRVGLAWARDATTADIEAFIGIVRGRTAHSSR